ncbi:WD40 repeat domain-containing protein [Actinoplanes sp. NPDC049265]|uniref:WD40 repeat domain-containing protein n=1 Tax=Actinoplanes sp. NPDC049265 TaxID=3363902 RepID=UPI0037229F0B
MSSGWVASPQAPHQFSGEGLGADFETERIEFAEIDGRPVVVFAGRSASDVPLRVLDLETGVRRPDRSLLHGWAVPSAMQLGRADGRPLLVTGSSDLVTVRDPATGEPAAPGRRGPAYPTAVGLGAGLVASANRDEIRVWELDGTPRATHPTGGLAFVEHGDRLLVVTGAAGQLQVLDALTAEPVGASFPGHDAMVAAVEHRGELLIVSQRWNQGPDAAPPAWNVSAGAEHTLPRLWRTGPEVPATSNETVWLTRLGLAEIGGELAAALVWKIGSERRVDIWLPGEEEALRSEGAGAGAVSAGFVAFAGEHGALSVLDTSTGVALESDLYGGPMEGFSGLGTAGGRPVVIFDSGRVWDLEGGRPIRHRAGDGPIVPATPARVATIRGDGIRIRDTASGSDVATIDHRNRHADGVPPYPVTALAVGGSLLATGSDNGLVRVWDVSTGEPIGMPWQGGAGPVSALGVTRWAGRPAVIAAHQPESPRLWLVDESSRGAGHTDPVTGLTAVVRAGRPGFASADESGAILLWDAAGRTVGGPIAAHDGEIGGLVYAGGILISAADDGIRRWDPDTGERIGEPLSEVGGGRLAATGSLVATVTDGHLRVWDAPTGAVVGDLRVPGEAAVHALAVADGKLVALTAGEPDPELFPDAEPELGMVTIWDVAAAVPLLPPWLTPEDRGAGVFTEVGGRVMAVHSTDAYTADGDEWTDPYEAGWLHLCDLATGERRATLEREAGWIQAIEVATVHGRPIAFVAAEEGVESWDLGRAARSGPDVAGLLGSVTCVAVTEVDGVAIVAVGDYEAGVSIYPHELRAVSGDRTPL